MASRPESGCRSPQPFIGIARKFSGTKHCPDGAYNKGLIFLHATTKRREGNALLIFNNVAATKDYWRELV
jgi:hypothetical protein